MKKGIILLLLSFFPVCPSFSQVNYSGNVELIDMSEDSSLLTFSVEGIAVKKGDVEQAAKRTLFHKLLYEGVEGVNDGEKLVQHEKKYLLEKFFEGKNNAPYNRFIKGVEQEGAIVKEDNDFKGTYNIVVKMNALIKDLKLNGIRDGGEVRSIRPKKAVGIEALKEAERKKVEEEKAERERERESQMHQRPQNNSSDSPVPEMMITKSGVGPFVIGMDIASLPNSLSGVYDKLVRQTMSYDDIHEDIYYIAYSNEEQTLCFEELNGKVLRIDIYTPIAKNDLGLNVNSTPSQLFAAGATILQDNGGVQGIWLDGVIWVGHEYTSSGLEKLTESVRGKKPSFTASDFKAGGANRITINPAISR